MESRLSHIVRRFHEVRTLLRRWIALVPEMEELWLQTRYRSKAELRLIFELKRAREEANRNLRTAELQIAHYRAKVHVPELRVPSRLSLAFRDFNLKLARRVNYSRADIQKFWNTTGKSWRRRKILLIRPHKVFLNFLGDAELMLLFAVALLRAGPDS
jgi:hypothetical protein